MSSRAIQRLREERGAKDIEPDLDEIEEEEYETNVTKGAFLSMMDDSDTSESEDESQESTQDDQDENGGQVGAKHEVETMAPGEVPADATNDKKKEPQHEEEDLDAILAEFEIHDETNIDDDSKPSAPWFYSIVSNLDARDLDIDFVMRTSLLSGTEEGPPPATSSRRSRQTFLFGPAREGWPRPPHYVGGGLGMSNYSDESNARSLPWPYSLQNQDESLEVATDHWQDPKHWFTFVHSDTYAKDLKDYERIQNSGDVNALALFVAHHPYVVEALLQLAMVLYRINQSQEGLSLLRRSLWILECSSLPSFRPLEGAACFMDFDHSENASYFLALFRLVQISGMQGCIRTSLAVSRFLLALDPLRDPTGILLLLDYFALMSQNNKYDQFLVNLVESKKISLNYRDDSSGKECRGELTELPNWAYSYALALYRLSQSAYDEDFSAKCDEALQSAIQKFPAVVEQLLIKNEVNTTGRSMRTDWPTALCHLRNYARNPVDWDDYDTITQHAASQANDLITKIFVQRSHALWSSDNILMWLYKNCVGLFSKSEEVNDFVRPHLSPTLIRYARCDPIDYEGRFQTLPQDANPLDPGLLVPALAVDPNRRRFLRRLDIPAEAMAQGENDGPNIFQGGGLVIGGPPTNVIDPDDPLVEVLWRSMLPWNTVDGVLPPRR